MKKILILCLFITGCKYQKALAPLSTGSFEEKFTQYLDTYVKSTKTSKSFDYSVQASAGYDTAVDYEKMYRERNTPTYKNLREGILSSLENYSITGKSKNDQIAFWINAYNFVAIDIVINKSGSSLAPSIVTITDEDFAAFKTYKYKIAGRNVSLDQIEKGIINDLIEGKDARLHFAVICASKGCPVLLQTPFRGDILEEQLNFITRAGLSHKRMYFQEDGEVFLGKIFLWYIEDFINDVAQNHDFELDEEYLEHFVKKFTNSSNSFPDYNAVGYICYDWILNKVDQRDSLILNDGDCHVVE